MKIKVKTVLMIIFIVLFLAVLLLAKLDSSVKMGTSKVIKEDNIEITINNVEQVKRSSSFLETDTKEDFVKLNITVRNMNNIKFDLGMFQMDMVDKKAKDNNGVMFDMFNSDIVTVIDANSSVTGDIYFKGTLNKNKELRYTTYSAGENSIHMEKYYFSLK